MPIRIYSLAKDLKIDSKELVELCAKAGITGKGSALASLTDEELDRVKAYLKVGGKPESGPSSASPLEPVRSGLTKAPLSRPPMMRPTAPAKPPGTKPPLIRNPAASAPPGGLSSRVGSTEADSEQPEAIEVEEHLELPPTVETPVVETPVAPPMAPVAETRGTTDTPVVSPPTTVAGPPAAGPGAAPISPSKPTSAGTGGAAPLAAFTRDSYIAPGGTSGKPRMLTPRSGKPPLDIKRESREASRPPQRREPVVRVAAIPQSGQTPPPVRSNEPAPQKPIMTLPADAIRNARSGSRAPLEQFTKQQDKKREREREQRPGGPPRAPVARPPITPPLDEEALAAKAARERRRQKETPGVVVEGDDGDRDKKLAAMAGSRTARQQKRRKTTTVSSPEEEDVEVRRKRRRLTRLGNNTAAPRKGSVSVDLPCTVRTLSEATGVPTAAIQRVLLQMGTMASINHEISPELAEMVAAELGMEVDFRQAASPEDQLIGRYDAIEDRDEDLSTRPPVVTFLGHVDHGKTSLLDRIIGINVVSGEAGGITQHIRAYKIKKGEREIAFVDTPGHEAFTEMRARGAHVTDIAVLVVAADDGVMPQTEEAISHAKAAGVPIVVALNKSDLPGADANRVLQQLAANDLLPAEWGGDVEVVKTSAITGDGIDTLLETLLLTADLHEYRANPKRPAMGTCLEAEQQGNQGVMAKLIVQNGTLSVGDLIVCGGAHGRIKAMYDTLNPRKKLASVGPSTPVNVTGLDIAPEAGQAFYEMQDVAEARTIAEQRQMQSRSKSLSGVTVRVSFEEFQRRMEEGRLGQKQEVQMLNLIIRADVRGSIEAILKEMDKLAHDEVAVRVLQASVGGITSADVTLADASDAVIIGFNVIPDEAARSLADERGVEIRRYDIIYKVTEDLRATLEGKLKPESRVMELGRALVQRTFVISRLGTVAGCRVLAGTIERNCRIRVNRNGRGIGEYPLDSLKREKDDAREVREGFECGIKLSGFNDLKEGDILEAFKIEEVARTL